MKKREKIKELIREVLAEQQVKNCHIANVVNQRELLLAFVKWAKTNTTDLQPKTEDVDDFLKSQ